METIYHVVNCEIRPRTREMISHELERVEEIVKNFPRPQAHVEIERSPRNAGFGVGIHVRLSTRPLFASARGGDLRSAVESTVDRLVRQARKHIAMLRRDEHAGAATARTAVHDRPPTAGELEAMRDLEDFRDMVGEHASRLNRVLRRERRLDPRAEQAGGAVSIPDIVEDSLTYVFEHFREKPKSMTPDRWLVRRGLIFLDEELDRASRAAAGSEAVLPEEEAREDWEELMDLPLFEPRPLDGRPAEASVACPEILGDRSEAQLATAEALKALPERQRQAILLRHLESYDVPEVAYVLNTSEAQVERWLLEGETNLQDRLRAWRGI